MSKYYKKKIKISSEAMSVQKNDTVRVVLFNSDNVYFTIDGVAKEVWNGINENKNLQDICANILATYKVDAKTLNKEVDKFIEDLLAQKIITIE